MNNNRIILVGGFHEMIELCESCGLDVVGIIDNNLSGFYLGFPVLGNDSDARQIFDSHNDCKLVITPDKPQVRNALVNYYKKIGFRFATIISPEAKVSKYAVIDEGAIIQSGVNISAGTHIGQFVRLNVNCNIMHDCDISEYVTVAPNAVCLGRVTVHSLAYIGANSTTLPEIEIGSGSIIGAGSVVTHNVPDNTVVKGVPAR